MDSSPAQSPSSIPRRQVEDALDALGLAMDEVPAPIVDRMVDRARQPGARLKVGRYLVVGELGRGGMGVVYEGWDPGIERRVAVKTVEPDLVPEEDREEVVERFRRETKLVGRLKHRAIVTVFDSGRERAQDPVTGRRTTALYYYVMEFLEGQSLARVLRDREHLDEAEALRIAIDIAEALQLSHDAGIIHRDIKPSNIFLRDGRDAILLDFGIAKTGNVALTRQGQILGTPSYLAPERLREKEVAIDGRADIFSLGVLLFTMLTGEAPFVGEDVYDVIDKIASASHPELDRRTEGGAALADVIDRMLAKRPEDRFQSADDVAEALRLVRRHFESPDLTDFEELDEDEFESLEDDERTSPSAPTPMPLEEDTGRLSTPEVDTVDRPAPTIGDLEATHTGPETEVFSAGAPHELAASIPSPSRPVEDTEAATPEKPVRVADVLGTRPDLALLRETRELRGGAATPIPEPETLDPDEFSPEDTSPSVPPGALLAATAGMDDDVEYPPHSEAYDESTDDETVADPSLRVPSDIRNQPIVRAHQRLIPTEQVVRASDPAHSELRTEAEPPVGSPSVRGVAPPRKGRSRIEASLVDEEEVVVKPAPLDEMNPDELPTHTGFELPGASTSRPEIVDRHEVETRGDVGLPDPAESQPDRPSLLPDGAEKLRDREMELSEPSGSVPELDVKPSAAVARRTIGPAPGRARKSPPQVRVKGDPVLEGFERSRLVRRRAVLLVAATLASIAIGLLLGRLNRSDTPAREEAAGGLVETTPAAPVVVEPRANRVRAAPGGEPELIRPRSAPDLVKDAEAARLSGHLDDAARLFEAAIRASADGSELRVKALLGRADVLRQLGEQDEAVRLYRMVAKGHSNTPQAEQARVALEELGRPLRRRRRSPRTEGAEPTPPPARAAAPSKSKLSADERCRAAVRDNLSSPRAAVRALRALQDDLPRSPCVFWYLGNKYEQLDEHPAAVRAYQRYLDLAPTSPRRGAVERKIRDLQARLRR